MSYIIEGIVRFNVEEGFLQHVEFEEQKVVLPASGVLILDLLLKNKGQVVPREEILEKVWVSRNLTPSNHSLNQYISILRKALLESGCETPVIINKLKEGFFITAEITCDSPKVKIAQSVRLNPLWLWSALLLALFALAQISLYYFYAGNKHKIQRLELFDIGLNYGCKAFATAKLSNENKKKALSLLQDYTSEISNHLICEPNSYYIISNEYAFAEGNKGRTFIAKCDYFNDEKMINAQCYSVYNYENQ